MSSPRLRCEEGPAFGLYSPCFSLNLKEHFGMLNPSVGSQ
uniref:Uncharacterized protein n=1 Tax=Arundo donax TaxID=35708 RepID=A0A0A9EJF3_ARUDO